MAKIGDLVEKLKDEAGKEADMFSGKSQREFFIEIMGAPSLSDLVGMYDPKEHNEEWDAERQKENPDIDKLMKPRRAIAFMSAGRLGVYKHYAETELRSHVQGVARMNWNLDCLSQTDDFTKLNSVKRS